MLRSGPHSNGAEAVSAAGATRKGQEADQHHPIFGSRCGCGYESGFGGGLGAAPAAAALAKAAVAASASSGKKEVKATKKAKAAASTKNVTKVKKLKAAPSRPARPAVADEDSVAYATCGSQEPAVAGEDSQETLTWEIPPLSPPAFPLAPEV